MKRKPLVYLNHAAPALRSSAVGYTLFCLGAFGLLAVLGAIKVFDAKVRDQDQAIAQLQHPAGVVVPQLSITESAAKREEINAVKGVMDELATPWESLFRMFENLQRPAVRIAAIEPSVRQRKLRLTAHAEDVESMLEFVGVLETQPMLADVRLLSQEQVTDDASAPLAFVLEAAWRI